MSPASHDLRGALAYLRPLIEGAQWMEDYGVFWVVTVK